MSTDSRARVLTTIWEVVHSRHRGRQLEFSFGLNCCVAWVGFFPPS
jgi:hypothetical protein